MGVPLDKCPICDSIDVPFGTVGRKDWLYVWGQDVNQKQYYDERSSAITNLNGTFYWMTDSEQYFYVKIIVAEDGVFDNAGNSYDANPNTPEIESSIKYKLKIGLNGNISILAELYECGTIPEAHYLYA